MENLIRPVLGAGLLGTAYWLAAPSLAVAQSCVYYPSTSTTTCTIAPGNYSSEIAHGVSGGSLQVSAAGTMTVQASAQQNAGLSFTNDGAPGMSSNNPQGANASGLTIDNSGSITLTTQNQNPSTTISLASIPGCPAARATAATPAKAKPSMAAVPRS